MRRTDQEFKAEVLRRSSAYKARRKKRMKQVLTTASCVAVVVMALGIFLPSAFGGSSMSTADSAAPESMMSMQNAASPEFAADCDSPAAQEPESDFNCGAGEEQSFIQVCSIADENFVELSAEDASMLHAYLDGDWAEASANCASDCILIVDGQTIYYHSGCGTFIDMSAYRSRTVEEETRLTINGILETYIQLESND